MEQHQQHRILLFDKLPLFYKAFCAIICAFLLLLFNVWRKQYLCVPVSPATFRISCVLWQHDVHTKDTYKYVNEGKRVGAREKSTFSLLPYILAIEWLCLVDGFCEYYSDVRCDILCYCRVVVSTCCSKCYFNDKIGKLKCAECTYTRSHDIENKQMMCTCAYSCSFHFMCSWSGCSSKYVHILHEIYIQYTFCVHFLVFMVVSLFARHHAALYHTSIFFRF